MPSKHRVSVGFSLHREKDADILAILGNLKDGEKIAFFRAAIRNQARGFAPQTDITNADIMNELATLREMIRGQPVAASEQPEPEPGQNEHADLDAILMNFGEV